MLSRRDFLKYAGSAAAFYSISGFPGLSEAAEENGYIDVNIPEFKLRFREMEFDISVGMPKDAYFKISGKRKDTETPTGKGIIYQKIPKFVFIYQDEPKKGQIIRYCLTKDGKTIKVPYEKMRALGVRMYAGNRWGLTDKYRIHSTTENWKIGEAASSGCIRMSIPDMLEFYPQVPLKTKILLQYDTLKLDKDGFIVYSDIYKKNVNTPENLEIKMKTAGIEKMDREKLQNILKRGLGKYIRYSEI